MNKKGTVWVIGASSGLGKATAEAFARDGWQVVAGARSFDEREETNDPTDTVRRLHLDVQKEGDCDAFVRKALQASERVDALVFAAALLVLGPCEHTGTDELSRVLDVNVLGAARMVNRALPVMRRQGEGRIILFSSINGLLGIPFQSAYTMSKHALEGYAECLAMETKDLGVQVCLVEPGDHRGGSSRTRLTAKDAEKDGAYRPAYQNACAVIHRDEANGLFPERLGEKVLRNANRRRMRFRLRVAKPDQHLAVWLHDVLPPYLNARILRGYYHTHH